VVTAYDHPDALFDSIVGRAVAGLERNRHVYVLDLQALGFVPRMSPDERRAYHSEQPIVDLTVAEHAALVKAAAVLAFVFPTRWWQPPPILKAWLERVMVPGLAFVLDEQHRVRPNLHHLEAMAGVTTYDMSAGSVRRVGDGSRRMLLRTLRANAPRRVNTSWSGLFDAAKASPEQCEEFLADVEHRLARL
jgi:putative NADPH-quinone reductase